MVMVVMTKLTQQSHDTESQASLIQRSVIQSKQAQVPQHKCLSTSASAQVPQHNKTGVYLHRVIQASEQRDDVANRDIGCENTGEDCEA
jgi:hypothetical protein